MLNTNDRKQMILEIATRIFSRYGYAKTSLDAVASEAHIAKGTIYYYFSNKEELFLKVVEEQSRLLTVELNEILDQTEGFEQKLKTFIQAPVKLMSQKMQVWIEGLKSIPFNFHNRFETFRMEKRAAMLEILQKILLLGQEEGKLSDDIDIVELSKAINDWFLNGNKSVVVIDFEMLLNGLEKDLDLITNLILYGIVKRG